MFDGITLIGISTIPIFLIPNLHRSFTVFSAPLCYKSRVFSYPFAAGLGDPAAGPTPLSDASPTPRPPIHRQSPSSL
jgi:hypothetical protein